MLLNLLKSMGISNIAIAGMDGYSKNIEENYYDPSLAVPRTMEEIENLNARLQSSLDLFIESYRRNGGKIEIITPSIFTFEK